MNKKQATIISALSVISFALLLLTFGRQGSPLSFRADLTKGKAYTISGVSKNLYQDIDDQIRITYYVSPKLTKLYPQPGEIEDLLREYAAYSHGKIRLSVVDPAKKGIEERISQLGIQGQQIQTVEKDKAEVAIVFSGILIEYLDKSDVIPFAFGLDTLEYDLTSRIRALVTGRERNVGVLIGNANETFDSNYKAFNQMFTQSGYKIRQIASGEEIPGTISCLFVIGGVEDFDDWALYRIDTYVRQGGKVFFAVDNFEITMQYGVNARKLEDKGLVALLTKYGATVNPELVLDVSAQTTTIQTANANGFPVFRIIRYPFWVSVPGEAGNSEHPVTSAFGGLDLYWPSSLTVKAPKGVSAVPLFVTTDQAWAERIGFIVSPEQEALFTQERKSTSGTKVLGAALSGVFPSYFANKEKPVREGSEETLPDWIENEQAKEARIIIVSNADFTQDNWNQADSRDMEFLVQTADWLGNDADIVNIRSRAPAVGRLDKILDEKKRAQAFVWSRVLNIIIIPALVLVAGIFLGQRRKARIKREVENYAN